LGGTAAFLSTEAAGSGMTSDGRPYTGDVITIGGTASGTFTSKDVGSGKAVTVKNESWNAKLTGGATLSGIGFNASYSGSNTKPTAFSLNGKSCAVK